MKRLLFCALVTVPVAFGGLAIAGGGQAGSTVAAAAPSKMTICHKTGSASNPWRRITVSSRAVANPNSSSGRVLRGHMRHTGDAVVVGTAACPSASATPAPSATPPTRMTICHKTGSTSTPYRRITVSSRAVTHPSSPAGQVLRGHMGHTGDMVVAGTAACPSAGASSQGSRLSANLQPVSGATGSGTTTVTIRPGQRQLCYSVTVTGLTNIIGAHIHRASTGAIVVPFATPTGGSSSGCVQVEKALLQEILSNPGGFYVNVHTTAFPGGQVQGNLTR